MVPKHIYVTKNSHDPMATQSNMSMLTTPRQVDTKFSILAGLYLAALVSPISSLSLIWLFEIDSLALAGVLFTTIGLCISTFVSWRVKHSGKWVKYLNSTLAAMLLPVGGLILMIVHLFYVVLFAAAILSDIQARPATVIGFAGFLSGMIAMYLGSKINDMARTRILEVNVNKMDIEMEWIAGWPDFEQNILLVCFSIFAVVLLGIIILNGHFTYHIITPLVIGSLLLAFAVHSVTAKRRYRVTPAGLEYCRSRELLPAQKLIPWNQFNGFKVTERGIILERSFPKPNIRCRRLDIYLDEKEIISALKTYIEKIE